jgi:predicted DNA-binding transcriptional regulator AlpA
MDTEVRLYRANQLYKMLNISNSTLYLWVKQNKFPPPIKRGGSSFWRVEQVNSWIDGNSNQEVTKAFLEE